MKSLLAATAALLLSASAASAVVGVGPSRDPSGVRRNTVGLVLSQGLCSGALIAEDLVLTAAHCVARNNVRFAISVGTDFKARQLAVVGVTVHPSFRYAPRPADAIGVDLALVRLALPAPRDMQPARVGAFGESGLLRVAGFGVGGNGRGDAGAGRLREATLLGRTVDWQSHRLIAGIGSDGERVLVGVGGCRGDSGGPVFAEGTGEVVGVVSWSSPAEGRRGGTCGGLTVATGAGDHADWIAAASVALRSGGEVASPTARFAREPRVQRQTRARTVSRAVRTRRD